jgi:hypothetical protein
MTDIKIRDSQGNISIPVPLIKKINKFLINQSEINKALKIDIEKIKAINKREKKQTLELKKSFDICEKIINKLLTNKN